MTISVDTSVFIDVLRRRGSAARQAFSTLVSSNEHLVASHVVYHELLVGAELHGDRLGQLKSINRALQQVELERLELGDMAGAAKVRVDLRRRGIAIGAFDLLIASQALSRGWKVVTGNRREFERVAGLEVIDWNGSVLEHSGNA